MSRLNFDDTRFQVNDPGPLGRGQRDSEVTPARKEYGEKRKRDAEAGKKRARTRELNRAQLANPLSQQPPPPPPPQHVTRRPAASGSAAPSYRAPQTPYPRAPPTPQLGLGRAPQQRLPLQPVSLNAQPLTYPDFQNVPSSPMPPFPTPPPTQSTSAVDWFSSLPPDERTTLLNALNAGGEEAGSSSLSGSDAGQHLPQLETFSGDNAPLYTDGDDGDGDNDQDSSWGRRPNDGWGQPSDDGPADEQSTPTSSLDITMRTVNPAYRRAHKRKRHADPADDEPSEDEQDEDDDSEEMQRPKKKSRSIAGRPEEHQRICECAFDKIKIELALRKPFPVSVGRSRTARARTDEFMELILEAWTDAAFDLELEHVKPTKDDIDLIRARVPQFRSGLKVIARRFVPGAYQLIDIRTLKNPTQESINAQLEANRKTVNDIMETFIYTNPKDITPETIFGNEIIQHVFTTYFFGTGDNNRAFYFEGDEAVPLVTFALVVVAIFCGIEEWSTGRWENKQFTHKTYFNVYKSTLAGLNKWMAYSEKRVADGRTSTNATIAAQERLLRHARAVSYKPEDNADGKGARDMFSMDAMFAL